jgi:hypothetical protein
LVGHVSMEGRGRGLGARTGGRAVMRLEWGTVGEMTGRVRRYTHSLWRGVAGCCVNGN